MTDRRATGCVALGTLVLACVAFSALGWIERDVPPEAVGGPVAAVTAPPVVAIDAALSTRVERMAGGDQKPVSPRPRLGSAVVPATNPRPALSSRAFTLVPSLHASTPCCRWAVGQRAPPDLPPR